MIKLTEKCNNNFLEQIMKKYFYSKQGKHSSFDIKELKMTRFYISDYSVMILVSSTTK